MYDPVEQYQKNIRLTNYFVQKWKHSFPKEYHDDLLAEARVSLWKACCHFNPERCKKFSSYAGRVIISGLAKFYIDNKNYFKNYFKNVSLQQYLNVDDERNPRDISEEIGYSINFDDMVLYQTVIKEANNYPILYMMTLYGLSQADIARKLNRSRARINQKFSKEKKNIIKNFHLEGWDDL